ncbi:hypothetical protein ROZALSC1DRAFT_21687, partial [Rozella allomycis CSF55]
MSRQIPMIKLSSRWDLISQHVKLAFKFISRCLLKNLWNDPCLTGVKAETEQIETGPNQTKDLRAYRAPTTSAVEIKMTRLGNNPSHRLILQGQWVIIEILDPHLLVRPTKSNHELKLQKFWKTNIRVKLISITTRLIIEALLNGQISKSGRLNIEGDEARHKSPCDELIKKSMQEKSYSIPR